MLTRYLRAVAIAMGLWSGSAHAQDTDGPYLEAFAGSSMLRDTEITGNVGGNASFKSGPVVGAALGYDYANSSFRSEIEFIYRSGDAKTFAGGATGDFASTTVMVNGYYDFKSLGSLTPYVGIGAGYVTEIDFDISGGRNPGEYSDRGGFAWQAMGGLNYAISKRIGLSGELRFFEAGSRNLTGSSGSIEADYAPFEALVGLRYRF
ncbi:outer membrane protein [Sphingorhabdus sp.]|jgi:opacity protein-like surface antigen|uniref:outer membrane protein n=1 Tax=Sphingorhabdus sp. TaxID=1902408 RepID=UPI0037CA5359